MGFDIKTLKSDLENLRSDKLKNFTYEETATIVEKLEAVCLEDDYLIESIEFVDICFGHAKDIDDKIKSNEFNNSSPTKAQKNNLQSRVKNLMHSFAISMHVSTSLLDRSEEVEQSLEKQQSEFLYQLSTQKEEVETKLKETKELILNEFNTSKEDIETKLQKTKELILSEFNTSKETIEANIRQEFDEQREKTSELDGCPPNRVRGCQCHESAVPQLHDHYPLQAPAGLHTPGCGTCALQRAHRAHSRV